MTLLYMQRRARRAERRDAQKLSKQHCMHASLPHNTLGPSEDCESVLSSSLPLQPVCVVFAAEGGVWRGLIRVIADVVRTSEHAEEER